MPLVTRRTRGPAYSAARICAVLLSTLSCGRQSGPASAESAGTGHRNEKENSTAAAPAAAKPALRLEGHRTTFDFLTNRVHAVAHLEGHLIVEAGGPDFLKYIDGGWKTSWILGEKDGGKPVAFVSGLSANLFVPLDTDGDGPAGTALGDVKLVLTMRSVVPNQRVSVFVNEKPAGTIEVEGSWQDHQVVLPGAALVKGENRIRLTFRAAGPIAGGRRSAAALTRLSVGPRESDAPAGVEALAPRDHTLGAGRRRAFVMPHASRLSFYVQVPREAKLVLAYGAAKPGASILVRTAQDSQQNSQDGSAPRTLFEGPISAGWTDAAWDLGAEAGRAVRIDLVSRGGGVAWGEPRLAVKAPTPSPVAPRKFDNIFVWMVDTLRADKVRAFNPKTRVETPNYDAFAADATLFAWAHVPGTWSLPSHASILTGVYPAVHKATAHEARLARQVPFIAELMKKGGYRTGLFSSNGYVSGKWGFDRGWDEIRNFIRESLPNGAEYLWKTTKSWMDQPANKGKPLFLYLATVEPHVIYNPKKEFLVKYWDKPYGGPIKPVMTGIQLGHIKTGKLKLNDTDKAYLEALYDAEVTQSDAAFGAFLEDLKQRGLFDSSVVVVVSDHGDEFFEHGNVGHAQGVYQELVHIPLMVRAPGVFPAGKVVEADVEAMDVFPTLLELAELPIPPETQGSSLLALAHDEIGHSPRAALSQNQGVTRGLKVARYRFIQGGLGRLELYDEIEDPLEQKNLAGNHPIALRKMRNVMGLLGAYESRWKKRSWGTAANVTEAFYTDLGS
jgi:arylsulfatase A-like enzyme